MSKREPMEGGGKEKYRACITHKMLAKAQAGWNTETDRNKSF